MCPASEPRRRACRSARVHAQSPPGDRPHGLPGTVSPLRAWQAHLRVAQRGCSSHRTPSGDRPWSGGQRLILNLARTVMRTFPSLPGLRGSRRRRASDLAASGLAPSRSPSSAYVRLSIAHRVPHKGRWPPIAPDRPSSEPLLTRWTWSIFRHSRGFSTAPSCLDSNSCSILGRSFETRNESQGRQSTPPRCPPLSESLTGSVPNRLGTHPFTLASIPKFRKTADFDALSRPTGGSCGPVASKAQHRKSHIFSLGAPCLFLKQVFEFHSFV